MFRRFETFRYQRQTHGADVSPGRFFGLGVSFVAAGPLLCTWLLACRSAVISAETDAVPVAVTVATPASSRASKAHVDRGTLAAAVDAGASGRVLIDWQSSDWRYWDRDVAPDGRWVQIDFDDARWLRGRAPLGYGDSDLRTTIAFGPSPERKNAVVWFRRHFHVDPDHISRDLRLRWWCDDGAVIYLNGRELVRCNLPAGKLTSRTLALKAVGPDRTIERRVHTRRIPADFLCVGNNVLAVAVHQAGPTSSDLGWDCALEESHPSFVPQP